MKGCLVFLFGLLTITTYSQQNPSGKNFFQISAGRVLFGTGDIAGFSINIEGSRSIMQKQKALLSKLFAGIELSFENGAKHPVIENPTAEEFISKSFAQVCNTILSGKVTYYPFRSFVKGFHIAVGPSIGYSQYSHEVSAQNRVIFPGYSRREVALRFDDGFIIGYRVSTGYDFYLTKRAAAGVRLDFSSYNNGDINTLAAGKIRYNF